MRTDLIGDDFRLDLSDPDTEGQRHGTARLGERTADVTAFCAHEGEDIMALVDGVDVWVSFMVDLAPAVKRQMETATLAAELK